jgi:hypothetical protein
LEPIKRAVGPWNFSDVSPKQMLGRFNSFAKSIIVRVNEARDLGDIDRYALYDHMKNYTAAPPDTLRVDEKNIREYPVSNCCGVIYTTNYKLDGLYLPPDDRRHHVSCSDRKAADFRANYFNDLYRWYESGGFGHVAAYLRNLDLSEFDPKAPPPKTPAFWDIVSANAAPEDADMADALDVLRWPDVVRIAELIVAARDGSFREYLEDRRNNRKISHRLDTAGYVRVRSDASDGLWAISGRRQAVYAKKTLTLRERQQAVADLSERGWKQ